MLCVQHGFVDFVAGARARRCSGAELMVGWLIYSSATVGVLLVASVLVSSTCRRLSCPVDSEPLLITSTNF